MSIELLFYHAMLNIAWMQTNNAHQFLFAGICGCPKSTEGAGGVLLNTTPQGECQFCGRQFEMIPMLARNNKKHQWLELYKTKEGQYATRTPIFAPAVKSSGPASASAICYQGQDAGTGMPWV